MTNQISRCRRIQQITNKQKHLTSSKKRPKFTRKQNKLPNLYNLADIRAVTRYNQVIAHYMTQLLQAQFASDDPSSPPDNKLAYFGRETHALSPKMRHCLPIIFTGMMRNPVNHTHPTVAHNKLTWQTSAPLRMRRLGLHRQITRTPQRMRPIPMRTARTYTRHTALRHHFN